MNNNIGCFSQCTSCPTKSECRSSFNKINLPTLNKDELNEIKKIIKNDQFYKKLKIKKVYSIKIIIVLFIMKDPLIVNYSHLIL